MKITEKELNAIIEDCQTMYETLEIIARGACLRQINGDACICYSCIAKSAIAKVEVN